ncbi:RE1, partial [Symbiodinium necroappetens]
DLQIRTSWCFFALWLKARRKRRLRLVQQAWMLWRWEQENQAQVEERRLILRKTALALEESDLVLALYHFAYVARDLRLEATGFPVQRYHADRAQELRAELAVQQLKAFVRKLLFVAELGKGYWFPCCHLGCEFMPVGHLVLVPSETPGDMKVLLTNTVYPLSAELKRDSKPRYRLKGKRSVADSGLKMSEIVVRLVREVRWVISAFTPRDIAVTTKEQWLAVEPDLKLPECVEWAALQREIPLSTGLPEARKELEKWKDPALEEVSSAYQKVREDLYASGAESLSVKIALIFAAGHPDWTGVTIDVKSAFLYAPIRSDTKGTEERIIVKPPHFLLELGIMTKEDRWWIRKALYGLPTSPRDWGRYRDAEFAKFRLHWGEDEYHLVQTISDDALWVARRATKAGYGDIEGLLVVYVDDLLFLAPQGLGEAFVTAVQERWKTSTPEWLSTRPLTFCGMELSQHDNGYRMSQSAYVRELLGRYCVEESASAPITRWTEPDEGPPPVAEEVKEAQAITGALLWLSSTVDVGIDVPYVIGSVPVMWESSRQSFVAEAVQPLVSELIEQDITISLLADNEAAIRAFDAAPAGWRSREYQIADIATKPLARLALLAMLPRAKGQPAEDRLDVSVGWLAWVFGVVATGVACLWGWWWVSSGMEPVLVGGFEGLVFEEDIELDEEVGSGALDTFSEGAVSVEAPLTGQATPLEASGSQGKCGVGARTVSGSEGGSEDEDFTHQEWLAAQAKFEREERFTGLTFVQRCKLRRALARGEVIDPPVFQQRFGLPPEWLTTFRDQDSEEVGSSASGAASEVGEATTVGPGTFELLRLLDLQGRLLLGCLNGRSAEWVCLRRTARAVFYHPLMILAARPGTSELLRLLDLQGGLLLGCLGIRSAEWGCLRRTARAVFHHALMILAARFQDTGVPHTLPIGMTGRVEFHFVAANGSYSWVPGDFLVGSSSTSFNTGLQVGGSSSEVPSDAGLQVGGSSGEVPSDAGLQVGGVSGEVLAGIDPLRGVQVPGSFIPSPEVQVGGSASSTDPCPARNHQYGGSSSSHGMGHHQDEWGLTYEDLTATEVNPDDFPIVGVWFRTHFLVQVFSVAGTVLLEWLGTRVPEWLCLRSVSSAIRYAFVSSLAGSLQSGPYMVMFSGPQWQVAVEEYILTGYPFNDVGAEDEPREGSSVALVVSTVSFPYVEWPPTVVVHFLWRIFALCGSRILACLGDRTPEWGCMYASAKGFRSHVVYALICWLRSTGIQRIADGPISYDAAQAYLRTGVRSYPFEALSEDEDVDIDERPHRARPPGGPVLRLRPVVDELLEASSSEGEVSSSTAEPSENLVDWSDGNEEERVPPGTPSPALVYQAGEGVLLCWYGDDCVQVPLQGWSISDVAAIGQGLNTGDWSVFQRVISEGDAETSVTPEEVHAIPGEEEDPGVGGSGFDVGSPLFGSSWRRYRGIWVFLLLLWLEVQAARGYEFSTGGFGPDYCPESQELMLRQAWPPHQDVEIPEEDCGCRSSSCWWEVVKVVLVLLTWEIVRRGCWCCPASQRRLVDVGCQTSLWNLVPLPLGEHVRCRAKILFCLWRAGFKIDADGYPERIQSEFNELVGGYLLRVESGGVSSSDSD